MERVTDKMLLEYLIKTPRSSIMITDVTGVTIQIRRKADGAGSIKFLHRFQKDKKSFRVVLGSFPEMNLDQARQAYLALDVKVKGKDKAEAEELLREEELLNVQAQILEFKKSKDNLKKQTSFKTFGLEWIQLKRRGWSKNSTIFFLAAFNCCEPLFQYRLKDINADLVLDLLTPYLDKMQYATINKILAFITGLLNYAVFKRYIDYNPIEQIKKFIPKKHATHRPCFPEESLKEDLVDFFNRASARFKPKKMALIFFCFFSLLRPNENGQIYIKNIHKDFVIVKTKTREEFRFPLSTQALAIVEEMKRVNDLKDDDLLFKMSNNFLSASFRKLGYKDIFTPHGIRSMGRQWLQRLPYAKESYIELCLSHVVGGSVQQAYNRSDYLEERRPLMQAWSDFICECAGDNFFKIFEKQE